VKCCDPSCQLDVDEPRTAAPTEADKGLVDKTLKIENCEILKSTLRTHFIIIRLLIRVRARTYLE
jgi:hypothetical protein